MITFGREKLIDVKDEVEDCKKHIQQSIKGNTEDALSIDWEYLSNLEALDMLCVVAARDDGLLVGFAGYVLENHPLHNVIQAMALTIYIHPENRKFGTAAKLIKVAEGILKEAGVKMMACTVTPAYDYSAILRRSGYHKTEIIYTKKL